MEMELKFEDVFDYPNDGDNPSDDEEGENYEQPIDPEEEEVMDVTKSSKTIDDFVLLKLIGKGAYGKVYQVREKKKGDIYAMKVLKKAHIIKTRNVEYTISERDILHTIKHPYIVTLHYAFQNHSHLYLVMDYMNGGQLFNQMYKEGFFDEKQSRFYAAQIVLAIDHLHQLNIIHRDLKPENILLDSEGNISVTDFGLAHQMTEEGERTRTYCGTIEFMSPEMIKGAGYDKSTDWWSVGVLLYDMMTGKTPFNGKDNGVIQKQILTKKITLPNYLSGEAHSIIKKFLERDPEKRLGSGPNGMKNIQSHPYFKQTNWKKIANKEVPAPFRPTIARGKLDTSQFDKEYTKAPAVVSPSTPVSESKTDLFKGFSYVRTPEGSLTYDGSLKLSSELGLLSSNSPTS
eukprot:TRINITY_DN18871_c0_g1_i1.p1 TRINITY_DN18871_c0_g1~~TRINITY_DN18871_c0_g1_i1.p1  ORF type:complete len:402 (-),score=86.56 TRINITY_DN18871_c0_g1_i1:77-1282(-)